MIVAPPNWCSSPVSAGQNGRLNPSNPSTGALDGGEHALGERLAHAARRFPPAAAFAHWCPTPAFARTMPQHCALRRATCATRAARHANRLWPQSCTHRRTPEACLRLPPPTPGLLHTQGSDRRVRASSADNATAMTWTNRTTQETFAVTKEVRVARSPPARPRRLLPPCRPHLGPGARHLGYRASAAAPGLLMPVSVALRYRRSRLPRSLAPQSPLVTSRRCTTSCRR